MEPRVAKLEAGLDLLTKNVSDLTTNVQRIATTIDDKFERLNIGLANAQAPKKTDWSLFISIGFFILALGSAVFWPLNKTAQDNKAEISKCAGELAEHQKLDSHPVSAALLKDIEKVLDLQRSKDDDELRQLRLLQKGK